jgi:glucose uptake protein
MLCLGLWASTLKVVKKWRFEFLGYDFAWGAVLASVIAAFTLGQWDSSELTFQDNFLLTGYRKIAWALVSGGLFMLGNMLLLAAITVSTMTMSFAMCFSMAWAIGAVWLFFIDAQTNPMLAFGGAIVLLISCVLAAIAARAHLEAEENKAAKALRADPRTTKKPPAKTAGRGMVLALVAGIIYGLAYPAVQNAVTEETRVSSYGTVLLMAVGIFSSTVLYVPFFLNFPVQGEPLAVRRYFKGSVKQHILGILGGALWIAGMLAWLVTGEAEVPRIDTEIAYSLSRLAPVVAILLGLAVWREFQGTVQKARMMLLAMLVLFLAGLMLVAVSPVYGR